jgi:RNA methyltransferase, TrmH family
MITQITSLANPRVAQIRDLHTTKGRKKSGLLLMEGPHLLEALLATDMLPLEVYYQPELLQRTPEGRALCARLLHPTSSLATISLFEVNERVAEALSEAQTSQGVVCVLPMQLLQAERLQARRVPACRPALLVLDDLADPGNLGTILRTALAADVQAVLLTAHCVDCYSPKVMRAAAGAHVGLPIEAHLSWPAIAEKVAHHCGVVAPQRVFRAEANALTPYYAENLVQPFVLLIGNEAHGLSAQAHALATHAISIPLANQVESLNAAMATGIILFEAVRQLRLS